MLVWGYSRHLDVVGSSWLAGAFMRLGFGVAISSWLAYACMGLGRCFAVVASCNSGACLGLGGRRLEIPARGLIWLFSFERLLLILVLTCPASKRFNCF